MIGPMPKRGAAKRFMPAALAALSLLAAPVAWAAGGPPVGVYGCYDPHMKYNPARNSFQLEIIPTPFVMFGLIDGGNYVDFDGHGGHYSYDSGRGIITMTDGSRQGWRYRKTAEWSFTLIGNEDGKEHYACPFANKDPSRHPW